MREELFSPMLTLFGLIAIGYLCGKWKVLDDVANARISSLILKVTLPATMLRSAAEQYLLDRGIVFRTSLLAVGIYLALPLLSRLVCKLLRMNRTYELMLIYSNIGFMGLPIVGSVFGQENTFFVVIFMLVFNIHMFTAGILILQGGKKEQGKDEETGEAKASFSKLLSPCVVGAVLSYLIVLFHIPVPAPATGLFASIGGITTPLAMMSIGAKLSGLAVRETLGKPQIFLMSFFRLILYPLLLLLLLRPLMGMGVVTKIAVLLTGLPVAGNVSILCTEYGGDTDSAAQGILVSTVLSLLTVTLFLSFLE